MTTLQCHVSLSLNRIIWHAALQTQKLQTQIKSWKLNKISNSLFLETVKPEVFSDRGKEIYTQSLQKARCNKQHCPVHLTTSVMFTCFEVQRNLSIKFAATGICCNSKQGRGAGLTQRVMLVRTFPTQLRASQLRHNYRFQFHQRNVHQGLHL